MMVAIRLISHCWQAHHFYLASLHFTAVINSYSLFFKFMILKLILIHIYVYFYGLHSLRECSIDLYSFNPRYIHMISLLLTLILFFTSESYNNSDITRNMYLGYNYYICMTYFVMRYLVVQWL